MNVLFSVVLLKINLHYLLTMTQKNKILNISVTAVRNLLASIVLPLGENCGVVYDQFRHLICMREVMSTISQNGYELVQHWLRVRRQASQLSNDIYKPYLWEWTQ